MALYLAGQMLLALLAVRGVLPESRLLTAQLAVSVIALLPGGLYASRRAGLGAMGGALAVAAVFAAALALVGFLCYNALAWSGETGMRLSAIAGGALLAGGLGLRGRSRKRRKPQRRAVGKRS